LWKLALLFFHIITGNNISYSTQDFVFSWKLLPASDACIQFLEILKAFQVLYLSSKWCVVQIPKANCNGIRKEVKKKCNQMKTTGKLMSESSLRKSIGSHIIGELSSHPRSKLVDCWMTWSATPLQNSTTKGERIINYIQVTTNPRWKFTWTKILILFLFSKSK